MVVPTLKYCLHLSKVLVWRRRLGKVRGCLLLPFTIEMTIFASRQRRLGEKPLYYGLINNKLVFASELKPFFEIKPASELSLDYSALLGYLRYGYVSAPWSIFREIKKLDPGHILSLDLKLPGTCQRVACLFEGKAIGVLKIASRPRNIRNGILVRQLIRWIP